VAVRRSDTRLDTLTMKLERGGSGGKEGGAVV